MTEVDVLRKKVLTADPLADLIDPELSEDAYWRITMTAGPNQGQWIGTAPVRISQQGLISERLKMPFTLANGGTAFMKADIEGQREGEGVIVDIVVTDSHSAARSFHCTATSTGPTSFEGEHHQPCLDPNNCGCAGYRGPFSLERVAIEDL